MEFSSLRVFDNLFEKNPVKADQISFIFGFAINLHAEKCYLSVFRTRNMSAELETICRLLNSISGWYLRSCTDYHLVLNHGYLTMNINFLPFQLEITSLWSYVIKKGILKKS